MACKGSCLNVTTNSQQWAHRCLEAAGARTCLHGASHAVGFLHVCLQQAQQCNVDLSQQARVPSLDDCSSEVWVSRRSAAGGHNAQRYPACCCNLLQCIHYTPAAQQPQVEVSHALHNRRQKPITSYG